MICEYKDNDIAFFMQAFHEGAYAFSKAALIRELYHNARIIVRSDGGNLSSYDWKSLNVEFYDEERIFTAANGGAAIHRMFELFFINQSKFLIKIDPDTVFYRRFRYLPSIDGIFGTLQELDGCKSIQGGFIGFSNSAAKKIHDSRLLLSALLIEPSVDTSGYLAILGRRAQRVGLASFDWSLGWAAQALNIEMYEFQDVLSMWKEPTDNGDLRYAITHPDPSRINCSS
jgi:hypothetical protein